ncbi:hypothetical protein CEXT_221481 [Caerostris extrusa]|uniref:Uncharacterized protein n=1 Tax=Caerostris extrusa TaxID=172846 RepID=A0AAV4PWA7_CAEEX|nr:hypothetical protein CEXT_221481 [Caerostris extrusa]
MKSKIMSSTRLESMTGMTHILKSVSERNLHRDSVSNLFDPPPPILLSSRIDLFFGCLASRKWSETISCTRTMILGGKGCTCLDA